MRDTYDAFTPPERGLFGDSEHQRRPGQRVTGASDLHDFTLIFRMEKPLAIAVSQDEGANAKWIWLPKSGIEFEKKAKGLVFVTMPERLAVEKGLL